MNDTKKRILIAIDGSVQSYNGASYISEMMPPAETAVVLYHVQADFKDLYFDMEEKPHDVTMDEAAYQEWGSVRRKTMMTRLEKIRAMFLEKGFGEDAIDIVSREMEIGVTRDIIKESQRGYDLLVVGKTGARSVTGVMTGSVTGKLISRVNHLPMVVVEGRPETDHILIGFDGSKGSIAAVQAVHYLVGPDKTYSMANVIRSLNLLTGEFDMFASSMDEFRFPDIDTRRVENQKKSIQKHMTQEKGRLLSLGVPESQVHTFILEGYASRSQALVEKARKEGYGTLVLGRRGHSAVMEFFMGRVGRKVIHMSDTLAVWIVN